jgi:hypothetical protein
LLALVATIKGDFLTVGNEARINIAELSLQTLLFDGEAGERATETSEDETREDEVPKHHSGALHSNGSCELAREDNDIEYWLAEIGK